MKALAPALLSALLLASACGGGGGSPGDARPLATPGLAAPRNVIAFGAKSATGFGLYAIGADGKGLVRLAEETDTVSFPAWSPDGTRVAYVVGGQGGASGQVRVYDYAASQAATVGTVPPLSNLGRPMAWSPDGKRLAFIEAQDGGRLALYDVAQGVVSDVPGILAAAVAWAPNSSRITIVRPASDNSASSIATVKTDGTGLDVLQQGSLLGDPRWSPTGRQLAFWSASSFALVDHKLRLSSGGGDGKDLGSGLDPAWPPTGDRIAFSAPDSTTPGANFDISLVDTAGGPPAAIEHAATLDRWPAWSPLGGAIVYLAAADPQTAFLCLVILETSKTNCLDTPGLQPSQPAWSPY